MIEKTLVLSTAHLKQKTNDWLIDTATSTDQEDNKNRNPFRHIKTRIEAHHYGFIIFLGDEPDVDELAHVPELISVIAYAKKYDCSIINFDRDADTIKGLKTYKW